MLWLVDRFGWDAAHNGSAREIRRMLRAEAIYKAARGYEAAANKAEWAEDHAAMNEIYTQALIVREAVNNGGS